VDSETQHTWRPVSIGRIRGDGQFDLVWSTDKPIRPIPYPRSRTQSEWESFLNDLYRGWGGWFNPGKGGSGRLAAAVPGSRSLTAALRPAQAAASAVRISSP
jgi:hypothetical protein